MPRASSVSDSARRIQAQHAALVRWHPDDVEAIDNARRDFTAVVAEDYIRRIVDSAPPLTTEQRGRLARVILSAGAA